MIMIAIEMNLMKGTKVSAELTVIKHHKRRCPLFHEHEYEPSEKCFREIDYWADPNKIASDLSVSAYMEAACRLAGEVPRGYENQYRKYGLGAAVGIDQDNCDGIFYYYSLVDSREYLVGPFYHKKNFNLKIEQNPL